VNDYIADPRILALCSDRIARGRAEERGGDTLFVPSEDEVGGCPGAIRAELVERVEQSILTIMNQLVKYPSVTDELDVIYSALGDSTRRGIVERLAHGELTVADIRQPLQMSAPAVSKHLRVLEHAGLVRRRRSGRHQVCVLRERPLFEAQRWIESQTAFWSSSLDSLADYLGEKA
jgi:DNA-binding transcriptional ArsR family regulator